MTYEEVIARLEAYEKADFGGERHLRRVNKLMKSETRKWTL